MQHSQSVIPAAQRPVPPRVVFQHGSDKFYVCPNALGRALTCGQRLPLFEDAACEEPVSTVSGAYAQVAQLALG